MKYVCGDCQRVFSHTAATTEHTSKNIQTALSTEKGMSLEYVDWFETSFSVCPFCLSKSFNEYVEPAEDIANVYIYDLTSGPQTALDELLAQGYKIVNRYAKAYHLEKPKTQLIEATKQ